MITQSDAICFRLDSDNDEYLLQPGDNAIGSSPNNDIVLAAEGVSRHHAVVHLAGTEVRVRDHSSKNGTLVNGSAVSSSPLGVGDELGIGAIRLRLSALDDDDAELAIDYTRPLMAPPIEASSRLTATLLQTDTSRADELLKFVADFFASWTQPANGSEEALSALATLLGAHGCAVVERPFEDEWAVYAAVGTVDELPRVLAEWSRRRTEYGSSSKPLVDWCCVAAGQRPLALVATGLPEGTDPATLLDTLVHLVAFLEGDSDPQELKPRADGSLPLPPGIVPSSTPAMRALYRQIGLLGGGNLPVLILGESGVGKEHVARYVHDTSERHHQPFIAINCAAIPSELLEAEMFGIGRGVATGVEPREGKFQAADGGTLFLDEIGDMSPELQAKLLRALQEREIVPLGLAPKRIDVRIVSATNTDLQKQITEGAFRQDLYYRLAGYEIEVPPLRQRRDDVPALVSHLVRNYSEEIHRPIRGVSVKVLRRLCDYRWPGNVRELKNLVRRLVSLCPEGRTIESTMLPIQLADPPLTEPVLEDLKLGTDSLPDHLEAVERQMIRRALQATAGNQTRAAKLLGVSRNGLAYRLKRLGLETETFWGPEAEQ